MRKSLEPKGERGVLGGASEASPPPMDFLEEAAAQFPPNHLLAQLIIMRHGEGEHNVLGIYNSSSKNPRYRDVFLTEKGIAEARRSGEKLLKAGISSTMVQAVFYSPLPRTRQTAEEVAKVLKLSPVLMIEEASLVEVNAGVREGMYYKDFPEHPWDASVFGGPPRPEAIEGGGEDDEDVRLRVLKFLDNVIDLTAKNSERNIIAVTHGTPAKKMIEALTGFPVRLKTSELASFPLSSLRSRLEQFAENRHYAASCKAEDEFVARKTGELRQLFSLKEALAFLEPS